MFARKSSAPSFFRSLLCIVTVAALGAYGTGCASGLQSANYPAASSTPDSRVAHFDRRNADDLVY